MSGSITLAVCAMIVGCTESVAPVQDVVVFDGNNQAAAVGDVLPTQLTVKVIRTDGSPATGVDVEWTAAAGAVGADVQPVAGSSVTTLTTRTNPDGLASVWWRLGAERGEQTVTARAKGSTGGTVFRASAGGVLALRYDGSQWRVALVDTTAPIATPDVAALYAVWGSSATSVMAVGTFCASTIGLFARYDGVTWRRSVFVYQSPSWKETPTSTCPQSVALVARELAVTGTSMSDVYMAFHGRLSLEAISSVYHFDGVSWTSIYEHGATNIARVVATVNVIWLDTNAKPWIATGIATASRAFASPQARAQAGLVKRYDGATWTTTYADTSKDFNSVWGSDLSHVFVVGKAGTIIQYDGASWSTATSGTSAELRAVDGSSAANVFAVGDAGTILRYAGGVWTPQASGTTANLYALKVISPTLVYAVGDGGTVVKYDGSTWTSMVAHPRIDLRGVWAADANAVYAVGVAK